MRLVCICALLTGVFGMLSDGYEAPFTDGTLRIWDYA